MEKLLIAVQSNKIADMLAAVFQKDYEVKSCIDGVEALQLLNAFRPDAMIIFLRLPLKDGFTVVTQTPHKPKTILGVIEWDNPYMQVKATRLGFDDLLVMPTINTIATRLTQLRLEKDNDPGEDPFLQAQLLLHSLGFSPKLAGWNMLRIGIPAFAKDPRQALSKELYPLIAREVGSTDGRAVEHSIRTCIEKAWLRHDAIIWAKYFPPNGDGKIPCPSNSLLLKTLAKEIIL